MYIPGGAGGILTRILQSHKESYWHSDWLNHDDPQESCPLVFPSNPMYFKKEEKPSNLNNRYYFYSCHGMPHYNYKMLGRYIRDFKQYEHLNHLFYDALKENTATAPNFIKYIYAYASEKFIVDRRKLVFRDGIMNEDVCCFEEFNKDYSNLAAYTVNMENILSRDFWVFQKEYIALVNKLKLTSRISAVRACTLSWNDRQSIDYDELF